MSEATINDRIQEELDSNDVLLFMKGSPVFPQCGFSAAVASTVETVRWC